MSKTKQHNKRYKEQVTSPKQNILREPRTKTIEDYVKEIVCTCSECVFYYEIDDESGCCSYLEQLGKKLYWPKHKAQQERSSECPLIQ